MTVQILTTGDLSPEEKEVKRSVSSSINWEVSNIGFGVNSTVNLGSIIMSVEVELTPKTLFSNISIVL